MIDQTVIIASDCGNHHEELSLDEAKTQFECGVITREQWVWSHHQQDWEPACTFFEKLRNQAKKASQRLMAVIEQTQRRAAAYGQSMPTGKTNSSAGSQKKHIPAESKQSGFGGLMGRMFKR